MKIFLDGNAEFNKRSLLNHLNSTSAESSNKFCNSQPVIGDIFQTGSSNSCVTPARSSMSLSRKRCVCESPTMDGYEIISTDGNLMGHLSISKSSYGSRRARSRIFSLKKLIELESPNFNDPKINKRIEQFSSHHANDSNTDKNSGSFHLSVSSDIHNESFEDYDNDHKGIVQCKHFEDQNNRYFKLPPVKPKQMSSIRGGSFAETVLFSSGDCCSK